MRAPYCFARYNVTGASAATAAASSVPEEAGPNPVREFSAERDGVVVGVVRGPVHVEIDAVKVVSL